MKALVLGLGRQARAVVYDLAKSERISSITGVDLEIDRARLHMNRLGGQKTRLHQMDASDLASLARLLDQDRPDVVICMLPPRLAFGAASVAVDASIPFVCSSYTGRMAELDEPARRNGVAVLPEMGMDPGIDLVLGRLALSELDTVWGLHSYAGGIPEPARAKDNPLGYKISWTFEGVLRSYKRPARLLRDGREMEIPGSRIFDPDHIHTLQVPSIGTLEAFPNGDALSYAKMYGMEDGSKDVGRFALRYPGHCQFWRVMSQLGMLEEEPLDRSDCKLSPLSFLVEHLSPKLQFQDDERDLVVARAKAWGFKQGVALRAAYDLIDYRDLETGLFAMNRTVGFSVSIGAQMLLTGEIPDRGVLTPVKHVPPRLFLDELRARGVDVTRTVEEE
jgi:saccharopine dehydrogenase-like NADP-dependent oxidoreductase